MYSRILRLALTVLAVLAPISLRSENSAPAPFSLAIVAKEITIARNKPDVFCVVLTNISREPQAVWEYSNSWGYQNISLEFNLPSGEKSTVLKKKQAFTRNGPSPFVVQPGEHQVYAVQLDQSWEVKPAIPKENEIPVSVRAIYEVGPTPESRKYKVWTGRIESHAYDFTLRQW